MTPVRLVIVAMVLTALVAGAAMYYLQVYAFYEEVGAEAAGGVQLTRADTGTPEAVAFDNFRAIDANSSPIRFRACFDTPLSQDDLRKSYTIAEAAEPLTGPGWFDCYDAREIGAALESGAALPIMGVKNIEYGIDRLVAVMPDGRGYAWHQINRCGEVVFDGEPVPDDCPAPPEDD
ncbi:DUF6446 family protein [Salibaculum halophilum]|uniref:DUF6446 family protein n=1 Tax=Salibaculum halophilum TaxID=1914408 RepID=UPI000A0F6B08|nr:DUF6446 family protein [Salibaculum halophilum]